MGWLLSLVPGGLWNLVPGGQIVGILSAIGSAIAAFLRATFEAISVVLANPVVLIVVGLGFGGGFWEGLRWNEAKVEAVNARIASMEKEWRDANARNAAEIADALLARQKAEDMARGIEKANREAAIRAARAADTERLRKPSVAPAPANPNPAPGWSLPGLPAVFGKN